MPRTTVAGPDGGAAAHGPASSVVSIRIGAPPLLCPALGRGQPTGSRMRQRAARSRSAHRRAYRPGAASSWSWRPRSTIAPAVHDRDLVGVADRGEPVGHDQHGLVAHQGGQGGLEQALVGGVERGGGLVEQHDGGVLEDGAGDRDALALAARETGPALADRRVVPLGQRPDEVVGLGGAGRRDHLVAGGVGPAEGDVLGHGAGEQVDVLEHDGDGVVELVGGQVAEVDPAEADRAGLRVPEPGHEVEQGRLAGAGGTDDGARRPRRHREVDAVEHVRPRPSS